MEQERSRSLKNVTPLISATEANHASGPDTSAKFDLCVGSWYSPAREIIDFSYFPNCKLFSLLKVSKRPMRGVPKQAVSKRCSLGKN